MKGTIAPWSYQPEDFKEAARLGSRSQKIEQKTWWSWISSAMIWIGFRRLKWASDPSLPGRAILHRLADDLDHWKSLTSPKSTWSKPSRPLLFPCGSIHRAPKISTMKSSKTEVLLDCLLWNDRHPFFQKGKRIFNVAIRTLQMQGNCHLWRRRRHHLGQQMGSRIPRNQAKSAVLYRTRASPWALTTGRIHHGRVDLPGATLDPFERGQPLLCLSLWWAKLLKELQEELLVWIPTLTIVVGLPCKKTGPPS